MKLLKGFLPFFVFQKDPLKAALKSFENGGGLDLFFSLPDFKIPCHLTLQLQLDQSSHKLLIKHPHPLQTPAQNLSLTYDLEGLNQLEDWLKADSELRYLPHQPLLFFETETDHLRHSQNPAFSDTEPRHPNIHSYSPKNPSLFSSLMPSTPSEMLRAVKFRLLGITSPPQVEILPEKMGGHRSTTLELRLKQVGIEEVLIVGNEKREQAVFGGVGLEGEDEAQDEDANQIVKEVEVDIMSRRKVVLLTVKVPELSDRRPIPLLRFSIPENAEFPIEVEIPRFSPLNLKDGKFGRHGHQHHHDSTSSPPPKSEGKNSFDLKAILRKMLGINGLPHGSRHHERPPFIVKSHKINNLGVEQIVIFHPFHRYHNHHDFSSQGKEPERFPGDKIPKLEGDPVIDLEKLLKGRHGNGGFYKAGICGGRTGPGIVKKIQWKVRKFFRCLGRKIGLEIDEHPHQRLHHSLHQKPPSWTECENSTIWTAPKTQHPDLLLLLLGTVTSLWVGFKLGEIRKNKLAQRTGPLSAFYEDHSDQQCVEVVVVDGEKSVSLLRERNACMLDVIPVKK